MAAQATTVIDIVAQVTDETASGSESAQKNVSKLERSMQNLQKQIMGMKGKSKLEVKATLKDMASKGIQAVADKGKAIAGKVWTVTLKAVDFVTAPFKKVLSLVTNPITQAAAFAGVSLGVADTINTFKDFEQGMANVKAISGATGKEFDDLTATAKQLGESTQFSAAQAAEAMENLAMAGWKSQDIIAGMPGLLDLAAAGSVDLATASDVTASALAQFGLKADEAGRVADILAATATNSKTDVTGLGESLKYAGPLAGSLGYSLEDVSVALGVMGNNAIDASSAGTALRGMLARMSKQEGLTAEESNAVADAMKKVGVSMTDEKGKSKSLLTVMQELRKGFSGMTDSEKAATAANLAGQNAMSGLLAIVNASDEDFNKLEQAITNSAGAAAEMAGIKMDTLQGSLYYLQSAAEGVKIALGEKLTPYVRGLVDWVTAHMPDIQNAVGAAVDFVTGKIDDTIAKVKELTGSPEWQQAETLWDKIQLAWDKLIVEPFDSWWNGTGKAWLAEKANSIGEGLGTALHNGLMAILGVDPSGAVEDGLDIGKSFADGFLKGFDGAEVGKALAEAIKSGMSALVSDAATLLPGGKEASSTSGVSAAILGAGALKVGSMGYKAYKGGKAIYNGAKGIGSAIGGITGISDGIQIARAAGNGGTAAQSALAMAQNGTLGFGTKVGAKMAGGASKVANVASKAAVPLAAVASVLDMGIDAYHGVGKAEEWTGSNSTGSKVASGIGAALGGTGDGIMGEESGWTKAKNIGGGALKGAGIGAAIGSVIPGVGTAIGGAVGAGVGAIGAGIGGSNIAKGLSVAGDAIKGFFTETVPEKFGEFKEGAAKFFTETVPQAVSNAGEKISGFFTETIPQKWDELVTGIGNFFTETVPYAIGYAAGKVQIFFTETIPQKWDEFITGIGNFFTETIPNAMEAVGEAVSTFFTETVPEFFSGLWDGIVGFFTETVPAAIETAGEAISTFFTETVPQFFSDLWDGITGFFTETIPNALETVGDALSTFFTETIPDKMQELWDGVVKFFTQSIPDAIGSVGETISGFFSSVKEKISGFFSGLWNKVTGSAGAGYEAATQKHAEGGIMTQPHVGLVAEDGAEAIIPLSGKRKSRGLALWERAGQMLGVRPYAEGGIAGVDNPDKDTPVPTDPTDKPQPPEGGDPPEPLPGPAGGGGGISVPVTIEQLTFEVNVDGGGGTDPQALADAIRENVRGMTDEIAYQLATALQQTFANTPKTAWEG